MWLVWLAGIVTVVGALKSIRAVAAGLWGWIRRVIECPDPLWLQIVVAVDGVGYELAYPFSQNPFRHPRIFTALHVPLTTWLGHPTRAVDSYRRHLQDLREYEDELKALIHGRAVRVPERS